MKLLHVIGITYLFDVLRDKNVQRVTVHAAADKLAAIQEHLLAEALFPVKPPCQFRPLAARVALSGGGCLTHFPLPHPGGAIGFRLSWPGHTLAYVTDTTARIDATYLDAIRGVDLLIHECYLPDSKAELANLTGHSVTSAVARLARDAGVGRLVMVHVDPSAEQDDPLKLEVAQDIFARTVVGRELMALDF
jgi:ribonuclease BN (tRNA processing enzyme)